MSIDLSNFTMVLDEEFDRPLSVYNGYSGIWNTGPRRGVLVTNSDQSVFLSKTTETSQGKGVGLNPLSVKNGVLSIDSGIIPEANRNAVADALSLAGQAASIAKVNYYTGMISTESTWGQSYGYYEISAKIPKGQGHWPSFWLSPTGEGWPPELDVFEAYGKGNNSKTFADNTFISAVHFDAKDEDGNPTQAVNIKNPYELDANGNPTSPTVKPIAGGQQYVFSEKVDATKLFGADIYDAFWTWGMKWTPETITFYFGKDHDHLVEIYKTPTPDDVHSPLAIVANDQIGSSWGWNPVPGEDAQTFANGNEFKIDYIRMYALDPVAQLQGSGRGMTLVDGDGSTRITDTIGSDRIVTGDGQDLITLSGGADTVFIERGEGNKIVEGFNGNDRVVLDGFFFDGVGDVMRRLTQVGDNVWLANGADPADPQTISFQNARVSDFSADDFRVRWSVTPDVWESPARNGARLTDTDGDGVVNAVAGGSKLTDVGSLFSGAKTLKGSLSGDLYYVYYDDTAIVEKARGGVDTVYVARDYALPANVENISVALAKDGLSLIGNAGGNRLEGTSASEVLQGGKGDDLVLTGGGADRIAYEQGDGYDTVIGFSAGSTIELRGIAFASFADLQDHLMSVGRDTVLDLGNNQSITLRDVAAGSLKTANFDFTIGPTSIVGRANDPNYVPTASSASNAANLLSIQSSASDGKLTADGEIQVSDRAGFDAFDFSSLELSGWDRAGSGLSDERERFGEVSPASSYEHSESDTRLGAIVADDAAASDNDGDIFRIDPTRGHYVSGEFLL